MTDTTQTSLFLKRAPIDDNEEDYDVLENGDIVGRIFHRGAISSTGHLAPIIGAAVPKPVGSANRNERQAANQANKMTSGLMIR
jgi:hypothetical protein